jgi:hypothetical protein
MLSGTWQPIICMLKQSVKPFIDSLGQVHWSLDSPTNWLADTPSQAQAKWKYVYWTAGQQVISSILKMGTESVPETLENFHILMWLSAWEDFIEFCGCKSCKTCLQCWHPSSFHSPDQFPLWHLQESPQNLSNSAPNLFITSSSNPTLCIPLFKPRSHQYCTLHSRWCYSLSRILSE